MNSIQYQNFEKERLIEFQKIIDLLPKQDDWSIECNVIKKTRGQENEADAIISKDGQKYALVEVKMSRKDISRILASTRRKAEVFNCPRIFIVFKETFFFFNTADNYLNLNSIPFDKDKIKEYLLSNFDNEFNKDEWADFFRGLSQELAGTRIDREDVKSALSKIVECTPQKEGNQLIVHPILVDKLFDSLLEEYKGDRLCRFTSLGSLFRTINEQKQSLCSIVCMNDKSEINYISNYLLEHKYISTKLHSGKVGDANQSFILSCCDIAKKEDLTMMRLYADDAKGVVLSYHIDRKKLNTYPMFILKKINYQMEDGSHPELNLIGTILKKNFGGYSISLPGLLKWSHFFKPKEYAVEEEVRLLFYDAGNQKYLGTDSKWIHDQTYNIMAQIRLFDITNKKKSIFPFFIESILLAPKMLEAEINQEQLEVLINDRDINVGSAPNSSLIELSKITHYR